jgi:hypothetical protein
VAKEHEQLKPIEIVENFKCLGRGTASADSDEVAALRNLEQARKKWASMRQVLIQDGAEPRTMVPCILLCGTMSESWVLTKDLMQQLRTFLH